MDCAVGIPVFIYMMKDSLKDITFNTKQVAQLFRTKMQSPLLKIKDSGKEPNVLSDVWAYRESYPTFNRKGTMGIKADLICINPDVIFVVTIYGDWSYDNFVKYQVCHCFY